MYSTQFFILAWAWQKEKVKFWSLRLREEKTSINNHETMTNPSVSSDKEFQIIAIHSGAERSLSQKKYIIDKTYTVWKVWAIPFRNSWRKNPDLAAFWEKRKNVIFLVSELENEGFIRISLEFWLELLTIDYKLKLTFMFFSRNFGFFRLFRIFQNVS